MPDKSRGLTLAGRSGTSRDVARRRSDLFEVNGLASFTNVATAATLCAETCRWQGSGRDPLRISRAAD